MYLRTACIILSLAGVGVARFGLVGEYSNNIPAPRKSRFIIELARDSDFEKITSQISSYASTKVYKVFKSDVFTGVSIETSRDNVDHLQLLPGASNVWPSKRVKMTIAESSHTFSENASAANYSIHHMTGVDKLHEAGILGKGVKVAIIDAGIDYNHPALGGGFGPGFKVVGGYDLVGGSAWPIEGFEKSPDDDPYEEDSLGHGTHVSGIVAGKTDSWQGVAPEASILSYKVFGGGDNGDTDEETLIEAFLRAYNDGADVITSSIGGRGGFSANAWAEIASRLVDRGIVVTISAGNDGAGGAFLAENGMSGTNVLAVASVEPQYVPGMPFEVTFEHKNGDVNKTTLGFFHGSLSHTFPTNFSGLPIIALSYDPYDTTIGCRFISENTRNLSGALVLVPRGSCSGASKRYALYAAGAEHVLLFNNEKLFPMAFNFETSRTEGVIEQGAGFAILEALRKGANVTARFFDESDANLVNMKNPAVVSSYFTTMGGLYDLQIKPDVAAPGSNIFSTIPGKAFGVKSGTSMATPYVAGIAALYISKYGGRKTHSPGFGKRLAARILASCNSVPWNDGMNMTDYDTWAPVFQLGNGLVNATKVLNYRTELSFAKFSLNDTVHHEASQSVKITNNCTSPVAYRFSLQAAGGYEVLDSTAEALVKLGPSVQGLFPKEMVPNVTFPESEFIVKPGQSREAKFVFETPEGLNKTAMPVYSGKIIITGSNGEELAVPYMGVGSNLRKTFRRMFLEGFPYILSSRNATPLRYKSNFTFNLALDEQDFPRLYIRLRWGASILRWDIFEAGWKEKSWKKYPPVAGEDGFVGMAATWDNERHSRFFDPDFHNELDLVRGPLRDLSRDEYDYPAYQAWWLGRLADGSKIKPGNYTMRIAALSPFGNPARSNHWDIYRRNFQVIGNY